MWQIIHKYLIVIHFVPILRISRKIGFYSIRVDFFCQRRQIYCISPDLYNTPFFILTIIDIDKNRFCRRLFLYK